ncbi:MAG: type IV pilus assembly protein PilM [Solirubrobacteraceae bacterium]
MPQLPSLNQLPSLDRLRSLNLKLGRRSAPQLVGLDIQPGYVAAVQASVNGSLRVERAVGAPLPGDAMREGEVLDEGTLAEVLRELFSKSHLDKRVRVGVANQRTVLRMLELPPLTDRKELDAAVRFQAADQMPMPLENAVLDYHALGIVETPAGQRQRVAVVAAQRDMVEKLLSAVRRAGLRPEAIDLSAFALIRALHRGQTPAAEGGEPGAQGSEPPAHVAPGRILYLNVGGLTNIAIAEETTCRFTRVVGGGLESIAAAIAERQQVPLTEARELLGSVDLAYLPAPEVVPAVFVESPPETTDAQAAEAFGEPAYPDPDQAYADPEPLALTHTDVEQVEVDHGQADVDREPVLSVGEPVTTPEFAEAATEPVAQSQAGVDVRQMLESGVREIAGEVRNSIDFHRMQEGGGEVSSIVLSGPALAISGFAQLLSTELGMDVRAQTVGFAGEAAGHIAPEHLAVAAGLAVEEAPGA